MSFRRIIVALLLLPAVAAAQTNTDEVAGTVMDESGGVLPGATVTATHPASRTVATRVTDAEGRFFLPALRVRPRRVGANVILVAPSGAPFTVNPGRRSRQHRRRTGAAARSAARSGAGARSADTRSLVRYRRVRAASA